MVAFLARCRATLEARARFGRAHDVVAIKYILSLPASERPRCSSTHAYGGGPSSNLSSVSTSGRRGIRVRIAHAPLGQPAVVAAVTPVATNAVPDGKEVVLAARASPREPPRNEGYQNRPRNRPEHQPTCGLTTRVEPEAGEADHSDDHDSNRRAPLAVVPPRAGVRLCRRIARRIAHGRRLTSKDGIRTRSQCCNN